MKYNRQILLKLKEELADKIENSTSDDLLNSPFSFSEFSPFVVVSYLRKVERDDIPTNVLAQINQELSCFPVAPVQADSWSSRLISKLIKFFKKLTND